MGSEMCIRDRDNMKRLHGDSVHRGKIYKKYSGLSDENNETNTLPVMQDENDDYESRIRKLGIKLREAVEIENYEEAARLRDMIHQLKKMDNTDDSTQGGGHDA